MVLIEDIEKIKYDESNLSVTHDIHIANKLKQIKTPYALVIDSEEALDNCWGHKYVLIDNGSLSKEEMEDYLQWAYCRQTHKGYIFLDNGVICISEVAFSDKEALYKMYEDSEAQKYLESIPSLNETAWIEYVENQYSHFDMFGYAMWIVRLKQTGEVIGRAGFQATDVNRKISLGYMIAKEYRGSGYGLMAADLCMKYATDNLEDFSIFAKVEATNVASQKILKMLSGKFPLLETIIN